MEKVEIGDLVKDQITGFKGAVKAYHDCPFNENTFCVKPMELWEGKTIPAEWIDESNLVVVEKRVVENIVPCPDPQFEIGQKVKDITSPYEGVIISISYFINGCIRYGVQSNKLEKGQPVDSLNFPENHIELKKSKPMKIEDNSQPEKRTGGPLRMPKEKNYE